MLGLAEADLTRWVGRPMSAIDARGVGEADARAKARKLNLEKSFVGRASWRRESSRREGAWRARQQTRINYLERGQS